MILSAIAVGLTACSIEKEEKSVVKDSAKKAEVMAKQVAGAMPNDAAHAHAMVGVNPHVMVGANPHAVMTAPVKKAMVAAPKQIDFQYTSNEQLSCDNGNQVLAFYNPEGKPYQAALVVDGNDNDQLVVPLVLTTSASGAKYSSAIPTIDLTLHTKGDQAMLDYTGVKGQVNTTCKVVKK